MNYNLNLQTAIPVMFKELEDSLLTLQESVPVLREHFEKYVLVKLNEKTNNLRSIIELRNAQIKECEKEIEILKEKLLLNSGKSSTTVVKDNLKLAKQNDHLIEQNRKLKLQITNLSNALKFYKTKIEHELGIEDLLNEK